MIHKSFLQQSVKANLNKKHFLKNLVNGMIFFLPASQPTNVVSQFGEAQTMSIKVRNAHIWDWDLTPQWRNARYPLFSTPLFFLISPFPELLHGNKSLYSCQLEGRRRRRRLRPEGLLFPWRTSKGSASYVEGLLS